MRDLLPAYDRFRAAGTAFGRAVITEVWGSAPRPSGASLLATAEGEIAGSVSGGCVETAAAQEIIAAIERGTPRLVSFGVSDEAAWEVGLACGGTLGLFVEPQVRREMVEPLRGEAGVVIATVVDGGIAPSTALLFDEQAQLVTALPPIGIPARDAAAAAARLTDLADPIGRAAAEALARCRSRTERFDGPHGEVTVLLEVHPRAARLVIVGGVHIAQALVPLAKQLGYRTFVVDGRAAFLTEDRFPQADQLVLGWPADVLGELGLDAATCVCVLSHDPKFDDPALEIALRSPAAYVGALGSQRTQAARRERLRRAGVTDEQLDRLHGPIGLDLGGREPAEIALAILAQMTAVRHGSAAAVRAP